MSQADRDLLYDGLSAYRLTRLVSADVITQPLRARLIRWAYRKRDVETFGEETRDAPDVWWDHRARDDEEAPKLAELVVCRWCVGVWCSILVACARHFFPRQWRPISRMLAISGSAALIAGLEKN